MTLPQPDATDPAHLRFAADVVEHTPVRRLGGGVPPVDTPRSPLELRLEADRRQREQADDYLVDEVAAICFRSMRAIAISIGVEVPDMIDWKGTVRKALRESGILQGGDVT